MATVVIRMKFCGKTHKITVKMKDDGDLSLHVATDCPEVKHYVQSCLGDTLTMDDVTDIKKSRVLNPDNLEKITMTCLAPNGIINAAWLELGMLSASRAKEVGCNIVEFQQ